MSESTGFWSAIKRAIGALFGGSAGEKSKHASAAPELAPDALNEATAVAELPITLKNGAGASLQPSAAIRRPLAGMLAVTAKLNPRKSRRPARKSAAARKTNKPVKSAARTVKRSNAGPVWIGAELRRRPEAAKSSTVVAFRPKTKPAMAKALSGNIRRAA